MPSSWKAYRWDLFLRKGWWRSKKRIVNSPQDEFDKAEQVFQSMPGFPLDLENQASRKLTRMLMKKMMNVLTSSWTSTAGSSISVSPKTAPDNQKP